MDSSALLRDAGDDRSDHPLSCYRSSRTVEQSNSRTVEQSNSRTVEQSNSRTVEQIQISNFKFNGIYLTSRYPRLLIHSHSCMRKILLSSKGFIILLTLNGDNQRVSAVCSTLLMRKKG